MKRIAILITALGAFYLAAPAHAQAPGQGFYLGGGAGSVWSKGGAFLGSIFIDTINEDTVAGGRVFAGHMSDDRWGLELGFHHLGTYDVQDLAGTKTDEFTTRAVSVAGVMSVPLGAGYSFAGRLGLAFTEAKYDCLVGCGTQPLVDARKRGTSGMIGLGLGARLAQGLSFRLDFDHFGSVHHAVGNIEYKESYDILSVNLVLLF